MVTSVAHLPTERPERYVKQMVSHLAHRRTTRMRSPDAGTVEFPAAVCELDSAPGMLVITVQADDTEALRRAQDVIGRHLERFAAREDLRVHWSAPH